MALRVDAGERVRVLGGPHGSHDGLPRRLVVLRAAVLARARAQRGLCAPVGRVIREQSAVGL